MFKCQCRYLHGIKFWINIFFLELISNETKQIFFNKISLFLHHFFFFLTNCAFKMKRVLCALAIHLFESLFTSFFNNLYFMFLFRIIFFFYHKETRMRNVIWSFAFCSMFPICFHFNHFKNKQGNKLLTLCFILPISLYDFERVHAVSKHICLLNPVHFLTFFFIPLHLYCSILTYKQ